MSTAYGAYSPIGSDYRVVARRDTHLIVECPADKKLAMKRMMGSSIAIIIILAVYIAVLFGIMIPQMLEMTPVFVILPIVLVAVMGLIPGMMYWTASKFAKPFTIELDKVSNKLQMCTPNPYATQGNYNRHGMYAAMGQYMTIAWDLDKVVIRACPAAEFNGPGSFMVKASFKHRFIIAVTTTTWSYPVVFFASERAELTQTLMEEIDAFLRGGPEPGGGWQSSEGEQPYPCRGY